MRYNSGIYALITEKKSVVIKLFNDKHIAMNSNTLWQCYGFFLTVVLKPLGIKI